MSSAEAPPSYEQATGSSSSSNHLQPVARNGIPPTVRRSMEDETRPLPQGWIRQYDSTHSHQFFVDTNKEPPRSIWTHPYDDEEYMSTLDPAERKRIREINRAPNQADVEAESTDEDERPPRKTAAAPGPSQGPSSSGGDGKPKGFGRKMKDKITNTTHEQRVAMREQRAREEEQAFLLHESLRRAMKRSFETGQPEYVGRDPKSGKEIYVEPPNGVPARTPRGAGQYYNPYVNGPYANPNAVFVRAPASPYDRRPGGGYGGGLGAPLAAGVLGGALLGGLAFGAF